MDGGGGVYVRGEERSKGGGRERKRERERISLGIPLNSIFTLDLTIITFKVWNVLSLSHFPTRRAFRRVNSSAYAF